MKHHNMLPFRRAALAAAALFIANTSAQEWGGQSQQYCSNQNTGSDYNAVTDIYNTYLSCSDNCKANYAFAVVQYQSCWCSDYIPAQQGDTDNCSQSCPGYPDNKCGDADSGLYGYIALDKAPSGTAGGGSSSQASSTAAPTTSSERVSTSTTSSSFSLRETTSSSIFFSSSTTPVVSSSDPPSTSSSSYSSSSAPVLTSSSQTSSPQTTSTSYSSSPEPSTSSSTPSTTSSSSVPPTTSSSSSTPPPTSSSSFTAAPESTTSSSSYSGVDSTPAPVVSTRIVTISGEAVTQTVTSTPTPIKVPAGAENQVVQSSDKLSGGAIAGIVIAVLAFLALLALVIFLLWRRRQANDPNNHGVPEMASTGGRRPTRNVSVLSKVGLLARSTHDTHGDDDADPSSAGPSHSARHSAFFAAGAAGGSDGVSPSSPLGPGSNASTSLYQMDSRRHSKPLVYDQRLNPSALFANAEANGSRISMADNTDYSRPLDLGGGRLAVRNPDPRSSFESRN